MPKLTCQLDGKMIGLPDVFSQLPNGSSTWCGGDAGSESRAPNLEPNDQPSKGSKGAGDRHPKNRGRLGIFFPKSLFVIAREFQHNRGERDMKSIMTSWRVGSGAPMGTLLPDL